MVFSHCFPNLKIVVKVSHKLLGQFMVSIYSCPQMALENTFLSSKIDYNFIGVKTVSSTLSMLAETVCCPLPLLVLIFFLLIVQLLKVLFGHIVVQLGATLLKLFWKCVIS